MENSNLKALAPLVGAKIIGLSRAGEPDSNDEIFGLDIVMPDGEKKILWLLSDFEGNGPGGFSIEDAE